MKFEIDEIVEVAYAIGRQRSGHRGKVTALNNIRALVKFHDGAIYNYGISELYKVSPLLLLAEAAQEEPSMEY